LGLVEALIACVREQHGYVELAFGAPSVWDCQLYAKAMKASKISAQQRGEVI
jgi:hypothetical protein